MTMPFLPTLATVIVLATASLFCPSGESPSPGAAARMIPASGAPSLAMAEPAAPAPEVAPRPPAVVAFGEVFPLTALAPMVSTAEPTTTAAIPASVATPAGPATRAASAARPQRRQTATGRRSCTGHHCPDNALAARPSVDSPFAAAKPSADPATATAEAETPAPASPSSLVPGALPFTDTVAEAVVPVARKVRAGLDAQIDGLGARVEQITGTAGDLVRGGRSVVKGSVAVLSDSLL